MSTEKPSRACPRKDCGKPLKPGATYCSQACNRAEQKDKGGFWITSAGQAASMARAKRAKKQGEPR